MDTGFLFDLSSQIEILLEWDGAREWVNLRKFGAMMTLSHQIISVSNIFTKDEEAKPLLNLAEQVENINNFSDAEFVSEKFIRSSARNIGAFLRRIRPLAQALKKELRDFLGCTREAEQLSISLITNMLTWCEDDGYFVDSARSVAQMDGDSEVKQENITFIESDVPVQFSMTQPIPKLLSNFPDIDLKTFLQRPKFITSFNWASSTGFLSSPFFVTIPRDLLTGDQDFLLKLRGVYLFRPTVELTFRMTGTSMHYGKLRFMLAPFTHVVNATYYADGRSVCSSEWFELSANGSRSVTFKVPFRSPTDWIDLTASHSSELRDHTEVRAIVVCPLTSVTGTASSISVEVYGRFVDLELSGMTTADAIAQMSSEAIQKSESGLTVSKGLSVLSDFMTVFENVPVIGAFVKPAANVVGRSAKMLKKYGFSVPPNLSNTIPVTSRLPFLNKSDDNPNSIVLANTQEACLSKDFSLVCDESDCMDILPIAQRPFLLYVGRISSSNAVGDELFKWYLKPTNMVHTNYSNNTVDNNAMYMSHISFISSFFSMWRGGFRFHISFTCSSYHSVKVRAVWDPNQTVTSGPAKGNSRLITMLMDISETTNYYFTIPYIQATHWQPTSEYDATNGSDTNGVFIMNLSTLLTSGAAVVNPIYFEINVSMAADFQLAIPNTNDTTHFGRIAQMDSTQNVSWKTLREMEYPVLYGSPSGYISENRNTSSTITSLKQMMNMLTPLKFIPDGIGARIIPAEDNALGTIHVNPYGSYSFRAESAGATASRSYRINYWLIFKSLYLFSRGGVRFVMASDCNRVDAPILQYKTTVYNTPDTFVSESGLGFQYQVSLTYNPGVAGGQTLIAQMPTSATAGETENVFRTGGDVNVVPTGTAYAFVNKVDSTQLDVIVPYNSVYNCCLNTLLNVRNFNDTPTLDITCPAYVYRGLYKVGESGVPAAPAPLSSRILQFVCYENKSPSGAVYGISNPVRYVLYAAGADDFICGVLLPMMRVVRGVNARKKRDVSDESVLDIINADDEEHERRRRAVISDFNPAHPRILRQMRGKKGIQIDMEAGYRDWETHKG